MLTEEQIQKRTTYLGGSDVAAVFGLSRWKTPLQVWGEKTGTLPIEKVNSIPMLVGTALEDTIGQLWMEQNKKTIYGQETEFFHPKYPFLGCHVDGLVKEDPDAIYEGKSAAAFKEHEWSDGETPAEYICQAMHNLAVTGKKRCYLGIIIGNHKFIGDRVIERDEEIIQHMIGKEVDFWNRFVIPKVMPQTITKNDAETLYELFPISDPSKILTLSDEANKLAEARNAVIQDIKNLEDIKDIHENNLKALLKDAEIGITAQFKITWKTQTRKSYVVKECSYRTLRCLDLNKSKNKGDK